MSSFYGMLMFWLIGGCITSASYFPFRIASRSMRDYDGNPSSYDPSEDAYEYRFFGCLFVFAGLFFIGMSMLAAHRFYP